MERPNVKNQLKQREVTGEIVFLDEMRRNGSGYPGKFDELNETAIEIYNVKADTYRNVYTFHGVRPEIMDLYEEYDGRLSDTEASCIALADELLTLKDKKSPLTFVDICIDQSAAGVLGKLKSLRAGELLTANDEQLAIESSGEHYPILDMRKEQADLIGVSLRVWGWNHEKYTYTDSSEEKPDFKRTLLAYPADEKLAQRQLEVTFSYYNSQAVKDGSGHFNESVSLMVTEHGQASLFRSISAMAYAETGYEGHKHQRLEDIDEADIAAFGDFIAEIVGDIPESIGMRQDRRLAEVVDAAASEQAKRAIRELIDVTWPAQANLILNLKPKGFDETLAQLLGSEDSADRAAALLRLYSSGERDLFYDEIQY